MDFRKIIKLWQEKQITSVSDLDNALEAFKVEFAYNSGKIENDKITYSDTREIFDSGRIVGYSGDTRAVFEQQNQKLCYEYLKHEIVKKTPISVELIKEVQKSLHQALMMSADILSTKNAPANLKEKIM